jgi:hypothetical protein
VSKLLTGTVRADTVCSPHQCSRSMACPLNRWALQPNWIMLAGLLLGVTQMQGAEAHWLEFKFLEAGPRGEEMEGKWSDRASR